MGNKASLMLQDDEIGQISEETGFSAQQIEKLYSRFTHLDRTNCGTLSKTDLLSIPELAINPLCERLIEMFFGSGGGGGGGGGGGCGHNPDDDEERINFRQFMRVLAAFRTSNHLQSQATTTNGTTTRPSGDSKSLGSGPRSAAAADLASPGATLKLNKDHHHQPASGKKAHSSESRIHKLRIIDNNNDRYSMPVMMAGESLSDCLRDKLYFLFKIYDADNDGRISFNDLRSILKMMVGNYIEDVQLDKIATRAFVEVDRDNDGFVEFGEFCRVFAGKDMDDKLRVKFF